MPHTRNSKDREFYVYVLFDWLGIPRYVGKGKGDRWAYHERYSDPRNWLKNEFIERTWTMLGEVPKIKVAENVSEIEAFTVEKAFIEALGRADLALGPLTNLTDGGEGLSGIIPYVPTGEALAARNAAVSRGHQRRSPEERRASALLRTARYTPEERSEWVHRRKVPFFTRETQIKAGKTSGKLWINNGSTNKRLKHNDVIPVGWKAGRLFGIPEKMLTICSESSWIYAGTVSKRLPKGDHLPAGWSFGRRPELPPRFCACGCGKLLRSRGSI